MVQADSKVVVVGGCGHVGLPLALVLASKGYSVSALDIDQSKVDQINLGVMPFMETGADSLLIEQLQKKNFLATTNRAVIQDADVVIIVIGTPVDEHFNPDPVAVRDALLDLVKYLSDDQLIILRSTVYPGVTRNLIKVLDDLGLKPDVTFCPERILENHALEELTVLPQIVGCDSDSAFFRSERVFANLGVKVLRTLPEEAELAKLFTNVWRYVKFAAANQFWMLASNLNLDYENVRQAIIFDYPRAADLPKAGFAAGPCLLKDTVQLQSVMQQEFPLGTAAITVNEGLPGFLVQKIKSEFDLSNLRVGILGVAFKGESDDPRSSLAFKLRKILMFEAKEVLCSDPYVKDERLVSQEELISKSDILIIGTPHQSYKMLHVEQPIIDIWNVVSK